MIDILNGNNILIKYIEKKLNENNLVLKHYCIFLIKIH
jgi:hypothetical protein